MARVDLYVRAEAATLAGHQCSISYTRDTTVFGYNAKTNHYHDRQTYYHNTKIRSQAVSRNDCQNQVRYLLDLTKKQLNRNLEPLKPTAFLTDSDQQESICIIQGNFKATAFYQKIYGVGVYRPQYKYKIFLSEASKNKHLLREIQSYERFINIIRWNLRISKNETRYNYKQDELAYHGRVLTCSYKGEFCEPTAKFPALIIWFQKDHCFVFFSDQFEAKLTKFKTQKWVKSLPGGKNPKNFCA